MHSSLYFPSLHFSKIIVLYQYMYWYLQKKLYNCHIPHISFESSSVLHISPTDTPSMQNLILEGLQQKLQKSCSRCNKNTRHIESSYILQPPKYLLLFVNRFRYLNNNITKDRPLDTTVMLGPLKFNLQATIDHLGPSIDSGHYTASINCCKKTFYCNDHKITEFGITDKNSSAAYIVLYKWIDRHMIFGLEQEGGSLIAPMALAHPLHPIDNRSRNKRRNLWVGRCVSSWWPWFPSRSSVLIYMYIYIYVHSLYEFCYRSYLQRECHSVLAKLHPITFYRGVRDSWSECHFVFSLVYQLCLALW